jgi:hypothetical protein
MRREQERGRPTVGQLGRPMRMDAALRGRRHAKAANSALQFLVSVEGVSEDDAHIRAANGIRWRVA